MSIRYPWCINNHWRDLIRASDTQGIADLIQSEFGFTVSDADQFMKICRDCLSCSNTWSESTWRMAIKHLLISSNLVVPVLPALDRNEDHVTAVLHTGFISILETEEQLAILDRRAEPTAGWLYPMHCWTYLDSIAISSIRGGVGRLKYLRENTEDDKQAPIARSKLSRSNHFIFPVNRVAQRVAPIPKNPEKCD